MAFNFFNLKTGEKVRIYYKGFKKENAPEKELTKEEQELARLAQEEHVLKAPLDELFEFKQPTAAAEEVMRLYVRKGNNIACEICGEETREDKIRFQNGKKICIDCFKESTK